jgi:hypothetical protein
MKSALLILFLAISIYPQDTVMNIRGLEVKLGMDIDDVWDLLSSKYNVIEDENNFFVSDNKDNPVCVITFESDKVQKIIKDWGTTYKTNAGQVFKILWNILREHEKDLNDVKIVPEQLFNADGDRSNILIYLSENRRLEINIRFNVTILEILDTPGSKN